MEAASEATEEVLGVTTMEEVSEEIMVEASEEVVIHHVGRRPEEH